MAAFAARLEEDPEGGPRLRAQEVDLVMGPGYLVTVRDGPVEEVEKRLGALVCSGEPHTPEAPGPALAHAALDALVDGHLPVMVRIAAVAEELEDALDPDDERSSVAALEALITLRRDLLAFRRLAVAQSEVLRRLTRVFPEVEARLSDVADNQREAIDMADATRDYIEGTVEAYRMRRDARSERGIRRLTVLAGILGLPTLLASIYGANFEFIPGAENPFGFFVFVGVQLVFVALAVWYLYGRGLL